MNNVTVIVVNYKTLELTKTCVQSLRKFYPDIPLILVDNNSNDASKTYIVSQSNEHTTVLLNSKNVGHGIALHQATMLVNTPYVFTLDSDTEILQKGFVEQMLAYFEVKEKLYAIGWLRYVNEMGVSGDEKKCNNLKPYVHPYAMLFDRKKYTTLATFEDSGAPCRLNMFDAIVKGYTLCDFKLEPYIKHWIAGTRRMFSGHWKPKDTDTPNPWQKDKTFPI